jgi:hypothetical protein
VYDMYPWSKHAATAHPGQAPRGERGGEQPSRERRVPGGRPPGLAHAVQVALDRRDNGGDAAAEPTAGLDRQ